MVALTSPDGPLPYMLQRAKRLRTLAKECRDLAQRLYSLPDRERVLEIAQQYDAEAARFREMAVPKG